MNTGCIRDIINRGGVKLNPSDVEALIDQHEVVLQNAIVLCSDLVERNRERWRRTSYATRGRTTPPSAFRTP